MSRVTGCIAFFLLSLASVGAQETPADPEPALIAGKPDAGDPEAPDPETHRPEELSDAQTSMCLLLESAARANDLPVEFFTRAIWQESRFRSDAVPRSD